MSDGTLRATTGPSGLHGELLSDRRSRFEDAGAIWIYDPVTDETDLIAMRGGTEWYSPGHRRRYVRRMIRYGVAFPKWPDPRGRAEWLRLATEAGWPPPGACPTDNKLR